MQYRAAELLYSSWDEIPLRKLKLILQLLTLIRWDIKNQWQNTYLKNLVLKQLFRKVSIFKLTTPEQRVDLFTHEIEWIKEFPITFPIKTYQLGGKTFHAPADTLSDITMDQLIESDISLFRYLRSEKSIYIGHFLAMIFTVKGEVLTDEILDQNSAILRKMPEAEIAAAIRSFIGGYNALRKSCPELFPPTPDPLKGDKNISNSPPQGGAGGGRVDPSKSWQSLLFELANTPGYPGMESAKKALAWEALPYFNHEQAKLRKQDQALKSSNR